MKHTFRTPQSARNKNSPAIKFAGSFAVAVEHCQIVIAAKKWVKLNQRQKLLEREKALIKERQRAGSLKRFCPRYLSFR